jgi:hypothetical protein
MLVELLEGHQLVASLLVSLLLTLVNPHFRLKVLCMFPDKFLKSFCLVDSTYPIRIEFKYHKGLSLTIVDVYVLPLL